MPYVNVSGPLTCHPIDGGLEQDVARNGKRFEMISKMRGIGLVPIFLVHKNLRIIS
jgi:hypothetical protein